MSKDAQNRPPHAPMAVAVTMMKKAERAGCNVTHLQLQQMLYLANALMLGCYRRPLVNRRFKAHEAGPVMPEIYRQLKEHGDLPLPTQQWHDHERYDDQQQEVIDAVFDHCRGKHGYTLLKMAYEKDGPYRKARQLRSRRHPNPEIADDIIQQHFSRHYAHGADDAPGTPGA